MGRMWVTANALLEFSMRAFIPCKDHVPYNVNFYSAWLGFSDMGFETIPYFDPSELLGVERGDVVVGGIGSCQAVLRRFGVQIPQINYPESLTPFLGRELWRSTINQVNNDIKSWPLFVKPVEDKKFTGKVIKGISDLVGCGISGENPPVICSEVVDFGAEWRCFVRYGEVLDVRPYKGDWRLHFDPSTIESAVKEYRDAPAGYGIDFGVTADRRTLLVEVNDGYALGCYGLQHDLYAQLLSARWSELMGVEDELSYIGVHSAM